VESYLLPEPDNCAATDCTREIERVVYGEIVQMKQDRIIPIFRCQVVEMIVSEYCGHWSSAGVSRYIRFREPKHGGMGIQANSSSWDSGTEQAHHSGNHRSDDVTHYFLE
jgi:hypothetical protein